jgi:hypothetical protein
MTTLTICPFQLWDHDALLHGDISNLQKWQNKLKHSKYISVVTCHVFGSHVCWCSMLVVSCDSVRQLLVSFGSKPKKKENLLVEVQHQRSVIMDALTPGAAGAAAASTPGPTDFRQFTSGITPTLQ